MKNLLRIFYSFDIVTENENVIITPFKSSEDGEPYEVWRVDTKETTYVLKKAKGCELDIYSSFFAEKVDGVPRYLCSTKNDGDEYFLMEYVEGVELLQCDRESIKKTLDSLIALQDKYWGAEDKSCVGYTFEKSLVGRKDRGNYLGDKSLEAYYSDFLEAYEILPRTLCHDDLLPFNVLVSDEKATIIDWEYAGMLPYLTSVARLLAHCEERADTFFYMSDEDKWFAVDYYYDNFVKQKGISYEEYRRHLDLFVFYEYCDWIMLGNKYDGANMERYNSYLEKAKLHMKMR